MIYKGAEVVNGGLFISFTAEGTTTYAPTGSAQAPATTHFMFFPKTSQQLEASVLPLDADNQALTWTTSDPKVATVADGLVTAVADGSGVTMSCTVTVTPEGLPGTQVGEGSGA